jgi:hypothetical protein
MTISRKCGNLQSFSIIQCCAEDGRTDVLIRDWEERLAYRGKKVKIMNLKPGPNEQEGLLDGLAKDGSL